jgi:hypothetical protein
MPLYHYVLMSQKDFLENQVIEEILRERAYFYGNVKKKDFWILIQPNFLNEPTLKQVIQSTNFYQQQKKYIQDDVSKKDYFVALISLNKEFIKWFELRIGAFETVEKKESMNYTSNGIYGKVLAPLNFPILEHSKQNLHPDVLVKKYKQSLRYFS